MAIHFSLIHSVLEKMSCGKAMETCGKIGASTVRYSRISERALNAKKMAARTVFILLRKRPGLPDLWLSATIGSRHVGLSLVNRLFLSETKNKRRTHAIRFSSHRRGSCIEYCLRRWKTIHDIPPTKMSSDYRQRPGIFGSLIITHQTTIQNKTTTADYFCKSRLYNN